MPSRIIAQRMDANRDKSANSSTNLNFAHPGSGADSVVPPPDSPAPQVSLTGGGAAPTRPFTHDNASDERMNTSNHQQPTPSIHPASSSLKLQPPRAATNGKRWGWTLRHVEKS